jgi:surface carbohydrate biosynthesis protein
MSPLAAPRVVLLVDDRNRDLLQATLIAHHLRSLGVESFLEPLEAYRSVLAAYQPGLIVFNHLTASHLATYSQRLHDLGVLTAVLPNEGIAYDPDTMRFIAGKFHRGAHIDLFLCWNEPHRRAVVETGVAASARIVMVGVPRFDLYVTPWNRLFPRPRLAPARPRILCCTSFVTAKFWELPRERGDLFFAAWKDRIPLYRDYWSAIEAHHRGRQRTLAFLDALVADGRYDLLLRPHPREDREFYERWQAGLPADRRDRLRIDTTSNITELILHCDLEISCETCTTALESWIAGKPTLELALERHPMWYREAQARCAVSCDAPERLLPAVEAALAGPSPAELLACRASHLETWCGAPDGTASLKVARAVVDALADRSAPDWRRLTSTDRRRALKLALLRRANLAYHFDPFLPLKRRLSPRRYAIKDYSYRKSITPGDVAEARRRLEGCLTDGAAQPERPADAERRS